MKFFADFFKGTLIGAGAILPGISSGVLCVIFGLYEKLVNSVLGIFKDFKNNVKFLFPICLGGLIGVLLLGNSLNFLFDKFHMQSLFAFMGLIIGTIPALIKQSNEKGFKLHYLFFSVISIGLTLFLIIYESSFSDTQFVYSNYSSLYYVLCGFFMSIGVVVPGVSSTVILMSLGIYGIYLESIASLNLVIIIPLAIGLIIGSLLWLKIIQVLLAKFYSQTFYSILGFVLGSLFILYPGFSFNLDGFISIILFFVCMYLSYTLQKKSDSSTHSLE